MIAEGMMMVHLPGVVLHPEGYLHLDEVLLQDADHHQDVGHLEMMDHPGEGLHLEEILEKGMAAGPGGLVLQEMILPEAETEIVALLEEVEETLEREEVLHPGVCHQEEGLLPEETLAEMMTVEVVLLAVHLLKVELGAAEVVTGLLLEEVLHQGAALLPEGGLHPGVEAPLPAEEGVMMAQLTGAVTALLPVTTLPQPQLNPDQPVKQKTQAGPLSSVSPRVTWDSPGFRDLLRLPGIVAS